MPSARRHQCRCRRAGAGQARPIERLADLAVRILAWVQADDAQSGVAQQHARRESGDAGPDNGYVVAATHLSRVTISSERSPFRAGRSFATIDRLPAHVVHHVHLGAVIEQIPHDLGPSGLGRVEERRLTLPAGHRVGPRDAGRQAGHVGDAGVDVRAGLAQDLHRLERERDDVFGRARAEHARAVPRADAGGGHERRHAGRVRQIDQRAMREQRADHVVVEGLRGAKQRRGAGGEQIVPEAVVASAAARLLEGELRVRIHAGVEQRLDEAERLRRPRPRTTVGPPRIVTAT